MDNVIINFDDGQFCIEKWNGNKSLHIYIDESGINIHTYIDKEQDFPHIEITWKDIAIYEKQIFERFAWIKQKVK